MVSSSPGTSVYGNSPGKNTGVGCYALFQGIFPTQGLNPGLPYCRQILLQSDPPGNPMNTGVGRLFLLQGIFSTQELNEGLLHCRQILYQLSYQGSPAESYDSSIPRFLKNLHILLHSSFTNLHSHQKCFLFSPTLSIDSSQIIVILTAQILWENVY